jgi:hypothetical protein
LHVIAGAIAVVFTYQGVAEEILDFDKGCAAKRANMVV